MSTLNPTLHSIGSIEPGIKFRLMQYDDCVKLEFFRAGDDAEPFAAFSAETVGQLNYLCTCIGEDTL